MLEVLRVREMGDPTRLTPTWRVAGEGGGRLIPVIAFILEFIKNMIVFVFPTGSILLAYLRCEGEMQL